MSYQRSFTLLLCLVILSLSALAQSGWEEKASPADISINRERGLSMLEDIKRR